MCVGGEKISPLTEAALRKDGGWNGRRITLQLGPFPWAFSITFVHLFHF